MKYSDSTLMRMTKEQLIEQIRCAEHNAEVANEFLAQQAENIKNMVKHGKWILVHEHVLLANGGYKEWDNFFCSECDTPSSSPTYYCPDCGARMDGGEK